MFVLQMCSVMERVWWSFSVERTWSTHCADWIGLSSVHIKARLPTSVSMRRGALPTGIGRVLAPDPGVTIHLPTITEDLPRQDTSHLHAMLCRAIAHPPGGTLHSTIAHRHVITGKKASHLQRNWGKIFCNSTFYFYFFNPRPPHRIRHNFQLQTFHGHDHLNTLLPSTALKSFFFVL